MPHIETEASDTKPVTTQAQGFRNITAGPLIRRAGDVVGLQEAYEQLQRNEVTLENLNPDNVNSVFHRVNDALDIISGTAALYLGSGDVATDVPEDLISLGSISYENDGQTILQAKTNGTDFTYGTGFRINPDSSWWTALAPLPSNIQGITPRRASTENLLRSIGDRPLAMLGADFTFDRVFTSLLGGAIRNVLRLDVGIINLSLTAQNDVFSSLGFNGLVPLTSFGMSAYQNVPRLIVRISNIEYDEGDIVDLGPQHTPYMLREGYYNLVGTDPANGRPIGRSGMRLGTSFGSSSRFYLGTSTGNNGLNRLENGPLPLSDAITDEQANLVYDAFAGLLGVRIDLLMEMKYTALNNITYSSALDLQRGDPSDYEAAIFLGACPRVPRIFSRDNIESDAGPDPVRGTVEINDTPITSLILQDINPTYALPEVGQPLVLPYRQLGQRFFTD